MINLHDSLRHEYPSCYGYLSHVIFTSCAVKRETALIVK